MAANARIVAKLCRVIAALEKRVRQLEYRS